MEHYSVTGMSCAACSSRVEKAVSKVDGVTECTVSLLTNSMTVEGTAAPEAIIQAVKDAGYEQGKDFMIAMDAASSEWKGEKKGEYVLPKSGTKFTSEELIEHWKKLVEKYPIISIEDALDAMALSTEL